MKEQLKEVCQLLNGAQMDEEDARKVAGCLSSSFNCFGGFEKIAVELYSGFTRTGKKRFDALFAVSMLELADRWRKNGRDYWDDRKKASMSFAYQNEDFFRSLYEKCIGHPMEEVVSDTTRPRSFVESYQFPREEAWVRGYLHKWVDIHPTLQQAFTKGVVKSGTYADLPFETANFPFI